MYRQRCRRVWDEIRVAFPDESKGSRILVTTRGGVIARHASPTPPHVLEPLNKNESWELLQKKAFQRGEWRSHHNLEEIGKELARSCGGLPLSIVLLGGILATKEKSHHVWSDSLGMSIHISLMRRGRHSETKLQPSAREFPAK
ncbi:hypothetical protein FNV43_RR20330 [Rhamnella rubrinervis]|uniref:NB-ARC domain-containing protein n=1 Tax=Rhamnella rubrinervis TaxID=2594499 RepID=A0A8K0GTA3_9ROSA|nr:hypothetical protein FNV43_RR20330 [Rhamnella rubrinervis]